MALVKHPWRQRWQQASFRGATFKVEADGRASGRRVALHEYPKRNAPYAEDMGRRAVRHTVEGYQIGPDYLGPRDQLIRALEEDGPGMLVHPLLPRMMVMVDHYAVNESRERGGYCSFTMTFTEAGSIDGVSGSENTQAAVGDGASALEGAASRSLTSTLNAPLLKTTR
jgi:prophage DNA circulation protein